MNRCPSKHLWHLSWLPPAATERPTAKARAMLRELNLDATAIPAAGERLTVADIEAWLATQRKPARAPGVGRARCVGTDAERSRRVPRTVGRGARHALDRALAPGSGRARLRGDRIRPQAVGRLRGALREAEQADALSAAAASGIPLGRAGQGDVRASTRPSSTNGAISTTRSILGLRYRRDRRSISASCRRRRT